MKKIYFAIIFVLTSLLICGCYDTKTAEEIEGYNSDIELVDKTIKEIHPNPFGFVSEEEWDRNISKLKKDLSKMSKDEINLKLMDIVSDIQDGHTNYRIELLEDDKVYQVGLKWFENDLRVWGTSKEYEDILGSKVLGINGVEIDEVIDKVSELIGYDNYISKNQFSTIFLQQYLILNYAGIAKEESITFNLEDNNGNKINQVVNTVELSESKNKEIVWYSDKLKNRKAPISEQKPDDASDSYWYKMVEEDEILFVSFKRCNDDNYNEFRSGLLDTINDNKQNIKSIVFDLRDNGGVSSSYMASLIIGIKSIEGIDNIDVYSFINGGSFSAGADAAIELAKYLNATTIGSDTGVIKYCYGDYIEVTLPSLNAQLNCSQKSFDYEQYVSKNILSKLIHKTEDGKETLGPEIYIEETFEDYKGGVDKCYEYVVKEQKNL